MPDATEVFFIPCKAWQKVGGRVCSVEFCLKDTRALEPSLCITVTNIEIKRGNVESRDRQYPELGSAPRERTLALLNVQMGGVSRKWPCLPFPVLYVPHVCWGTRRRGNRRWNWRPSRRRIWDLSDHLWYHLLLLRDCHSLGHNTR